jgi:hypothetical protein
VFGHVIAHSSEWDFENIDLSEIDNNEMLVKFKEIFGYDIEERPTLFIFSNYI